MARQRKRRSGSSASNAIGARERRFPNGVQPPGRSAFPGKLALAAILALLAVGAIWWAASRRTTDVLAAVQPPANVASDEAARRRSLRSSAERLDRADSVPMAERVAQHLNTLLSLAGSGENAAEKLASLIAPGFSGESLRPRQLERVFRDDCVLVQRMTRPHDPARSATAGIRATTSDFLLLLASLQPVIGPPNHWRTTFSVGQVRPHDRGLTADVSVDLVSGSPEHRAQVHGKWECSWDIDGNQWRLERLRVLDYGEIVARYPDRSWLVEHTLSVLAQNPSYGRQLAFGLEHWRHRIESAHQMRHSAAYGIAVGDANGDGLDDLYLCQPGGLPNRMFLQNLDGTASDVSVRSKVDWLDSTSSAIFVDLDNDGDEDLVLATNGGLLALSNDGAAGFEPAALLPAENAGSESLSAADYDNDGDLDLFACLTALNESGPPFRLFRNEFVPSGKLEWTDATEASGLRAASVSGAYAASWEDYDDDGDQDLCVANRDRPISLYRNDGGRFDAVTSLFAASKAHSVGWVDYDRDGAIDLYAHGRDLTNVYNPIGFRSPQGTGNTMHREDARVDSNRSSWFFRSTASGSFEAVRDIVGLDPGLSARTSLWLDLNNDGWDDLITTADSHRCWLNLGGPQYAEATSIAQIQLPDEGVAIAATDWDQDGDLDLWIANRTGPQLRFLSNETPTNQHYLSIRLVGKASNRDAIGARVEVIASGAKPLRRTLRAGEGYLTQSSKWLHFGLGRSLKIERVDVRWPGGTEEAFHGLAVDGHYQLIEGTGLADLIQAGERTIVLHPGTALDADSSAVPRLAVESTRSTTPVQDRAEMATVPVPALHAEPLNMPVHVLLSEPASLPRLSYTAPGGGKQSIRPLNDRGLLLWFDTGLAADVAPVAGSDLDAGHATDRAPLMELVSRYAELQQAGVDLVVLDADPDFIAHLQTTSEPQLAAATAEPRSAETQGPLFRHGHATAELLEAIDRVVGERFDCGDGESGPTSPGPDFDGSSAPRGDRHRATGDLATRHGDRHRGGGAAGHCLSPPCGVLIDPRGRLSAIYGTAVSPERVLSDVWKFDLDVSQRRAAALPFPGRWISSIDAAVAAPPAAGGDPAR